MNRYLPIIATSVRYFILCWLLNACYAFGEELIQVPITAYHNKPPYMIDIEAEQGLYFDFVRLLNEKSHVYHFTLTFIPRNRVRNMVIAENFGGIVLGVSPLWFDDVAQTKYLWSSAVFHDEDIFVSLNKNPFEFLDASSLVGKQICLVLGNYYSGVSDQEKQLALTLLHTSREITIFDLLDKKRCELGIVSRSTYRYFLDHENILNQYHVSKALHDQFERRVLLAKVQQPVLQFIEQVLKDWPVGEAQ
ncbi:hypothetical protein R50072_07050 [Simiduia litorea]